MKQDNTLLIVAVIGVALYLLSKYASPNPNADMGGKDFGVTNPSDWGG